LYSLVSNINIRGPALGYSMAKMTVEATLTRNGRMINSLFTIELKEVNLVHDSVGALVDKLPVVLAAGAKPQLPDW
jgi:hypothetical protein